MSLSAIFDPMVRAHFKNKFGSAEGGTGSGIDGLYAFRGDSEAYYVGELKLGRCGEYLEIEGIEKVNNTTSAITFIYLPNSGGETYTSVTTSGVDTLIANYEDGILSLADMDGNSLLVNIPAPLADDFPAGLYINLDVVAPNIPAMILYVYHA